MLESDVGENKFYVSEKGGDQRRRGMNMTGKSENWKTLDTTRL